jgi:hypothetical protein
MPADDFAILDAEKELGGTLDVKLSDGRRIGDDLHQHVELRETQAGAKRVLCW